MPPVRIVQQPLEGEDAGGWRMKRIKIVYAVSWVQRAIDVEEVYGVSHGVALEGRADARCLCVRHG